MKPSDIFAAADPQADIIPSDIYVDEEANWFYDGRQIIREDILELFYDNLDFSQNGQFIIHWQGKNYSLDVADTPFVIIRVDKRHRNDGTEFLEIRLKHLKTSQELDLNTLVIGEKNVLYCRIRGGRIPARFSRPAYYQVAQWIDQDPKTELFFIELNGIRYPIRAK